MRHAHDDLFDAAVAGLLDERIEQRDECFAAFEGEALLPDVLGVQELLEPLDCGDSEENALAVLSAQLWLVQRRLHTFLQPGALVLVEDVHVLDAKGAAIRGPQTGDQVAQGRARAALERRAIHHPIEVGVREPELRRLEQGVARLVVAQRIQVGDQVAELAIGVNQVEDADVALEGRLGAYGGGVRPVAPGRFEAGKEQRPMRPDRRRVAQILLVQAVNVIGIRPIDEIQVGHHRVLTMGFPA